MIDKAIVFACGDQEPLSDYPEIAALLQFEGLEAYVKRVHMPEGVLCSRCGPNTPDYWGMVCQLITANAGTDWPITKRTLGPIRSRVVSREDEEL